MYIYRKKIYRRDIKYSKIQYYVLRAVYKSMI